MKIKKFSLIKYSAENLERIKKVIKIISDDLELQKINRLAGNKIPLKRFIDESLSFIEAVETLKLVQKEFGLFKIANLEIERMIEPAPYIFDTNYIYVEKENKNKILKILNLTEDDIRNNLIVRANSLDITERLKEILAEIDNMSQETSGLPENWGWFNKKKGEYQFGKINFKQTGKIRKEVFIALMDTYGISPQASSIQTIKEKTGVKPERIRIEISAINKRLIKKIGSYFKGSGKGYYTLEKLMSDKSN